MAERIDQRANKNLIYPGDSTGRPSIIPEEGASESPVIEDTSYERIEALRAARAGEGAGAEGRADVNGETAPSHPRMVEQDLPGADVSTGGEDSSMRRALGEDLPAEDAPAPIDDLGGYHTPI